MSADNIIDLDAKQEAEAMMEDKTSPEYYRVVFNRLLNDYIDEIPEFEVNSFTPPTPEGRGYKVRKGWFFQLGGYLDYLAQDGYVPMEDVQEFHEHSVYWTSPEFRERLTTKEDIDLANAYLRKALDFVDERELELQQWKAA